MIKSVFVVPGGKNECVCETLYLYEAAHHILVKHRQAGPALPEYVQSVYRHDDRLLPRLIHQQNVDAAVAQAKRVVRRSEENNKYVLRV